MAEMDIAWEALLLKEKVYLPGPPNQATTRRKLVDMPEKDAPRMVPFGLHENRLTRWMKVLPKRFTDPKTKFLMDAYRDYDRMSERERRRYDEQFAQLEGGRRLEKPSMPKLTFGPRGVYEHQLNPRPSIQDKPELPVGVPLQPDPMASMDPDQVKVEFEDVPRSWNPFGPSTNWWNKVFGGKERGEEIPELVRSIIDKDRAGKTLYPNERQILSRWVRGLPPMAFHHAALQEGYVPKGTEGKKMSEQEIMAHAEKLLAEREGEGLAVEDSPEGGGPVLVDGEGNVVEQAREDPPTVGLSADLPKRSTKTGDWHKGFEVAGLGGRGKDKRGIGTAFRQFLHTHHPDHSEFPPLPETGTLDPVKGLREHIYPGGDEQNAARTYFLKFVQPVLGRMSQEERVKYLRQFPGWEGMPEHWGYKQQSVIPEESGRRGLEEEGDSEISPEGSGVQYDLSEDEPIDLAWSILKVG